MKTEEAFVGARAVDSYPYSVGGTAKQAAALADSGVDCFIGYLGHINAERLNNILLAGMAFMPVTKAGEYSDGAADEIAQLKALGIPAGVSVWLDLEGLEAFHTDPLLLIKKINEWADEIKKAGWMPCLYVGAPQPLTGKELFSLHVVRYWLGLGRCVDRHNVDAYPDCGWCMIQQWHGEANGMLWKNTGVLVDTNGIGKDHRRRLPTWVIA